MPVMPDKRRLTTAFAILFASLVLALAWLLARELIIGHITETNRQLLSKAQKGQPWFDWLLNEPERVVGPYKTHWKSAPVSGLTNQTRHPVLSLPFDGRLLDARYFPQLRLIYSATKPWLLRIHFNETDPNIEFISTEVLLPAGAHLTKTLDLRQLRWEKHPLSQSMLTIPDAKTTGRWGGESHAVSALLLYFRPAGKVGNADKTRHQYALTLHAVTFPWQTDTFSSSGESVPAIEVETLNCNQLPSPSRNSLLVGQLERPCISPEWIIAQDMASRAQRYRLYLPRPQRLLPPSLESWLTSALFVLVGVILLVFCNKAGENPRTLNGHKIWLLFAVPVLLLINYFSPVLAEWLGAINHWTVILLSMAVLAMLWPWLSQVVKTEWVQWQKEAVQKSITALTIILTSAFIAGILFHYGIGRPSLKAFAVYLVWALIQQAVIGPFIANHLHTRCRLPKTTAAVLAGLVFGLLHFPNPLLMLLTTFAGTLWAWLWLETRLLLPLAISHATLALALFSLADHWWLVSGRVGIQFFSS